MKNHLFEKLSDDSDKILTPVFEYSQQNTIEQGAIELYNNFAGYNAILNDHHPSNISNALNGERSIVIAHSLGGIETRQIDKYVHIDSELNPVFSAFATFDSPHQGAEIQTSLRNGEFQNLLTKYCDAFWDLSLAQAYESFDVDMKGAFGFFLNGFAQSLKSTLYMYLDENEDLQDLVCDDFVGQGVFSVLESNINPPIGHGLDPYTGIIDELNSHVIDMPNLAVVGIETGSGGPENPIDGHMALREIYSLKNGVNHGEFNAEYDEGYIEPYEELKSYLNSQYIWYGLGPDMSYRYFRTDWLCNEPYPENIVSSDEPCIIKGGNPEILLEPWPYLGICCTNHMWCDLPHPNPSLGNKYLAAHRLISDFDKAYRILFGHLKVEYENNGTVTSCHCYAAWNNDEIESDYSVPCIESFLNEEWASNPYFYCQDEEEPTYGYVEHIFPGDGVVITESQAYFPGVKNTRRFTDTNHQQTRNIQQTKDTFDEMFDNNIYGPEFHLFKH